MRAEVPRPVESVGNGGLGTGGWREGFSCDLRARASLGWIGFCGNRWLALRKAGAATAGTSQGRKKLLCEWTGVCDLPVPKSRCADRHGPPRTMSREPGSRTGERSQWSPALQGLGCLVTASASFPRRTRMESCVGDGARYDWTVMQVVGSAC